ncbi:hypothetical protein BCON_0016g00770 [Botryotinia convoluta]|uniref:Uncharacterized protein n=1 Tax=Botryotinia convoluta TaxID=54673 RepID=A0A4Z1IQQ5_9HELO|nr:hypothetical protein BCON_0016g00770 [Botryotinia convoluta]
MTAEVLTGCVEYLLILYTYYEIMQSLAGSIAPKVKLSEEVVRLSPPVLSKKQQIKKSFRADDFALIR